MQKTIRTLCYFVQTDIKKSIQRLTHLKYQLEKAGFVIQTVRLCSPSLVIDALPTLPNTELLYSWGTVSREELRARAATFLRVDNPIFANVDLSEGVEDADVDWVWMMLQHNPAKLFHFAYTFQSPNNASPYFPTASSMRDGFAVGLQSTDLAASCATLGEWFEVQRIVWDELKVLLAGEADFLGIDSSVAPLYEGDSSLVHHITRWFGDFEACVTSDIFMQITQFIKSQNPMPTGLCGLMLPCLEDFGLADLYERGAFSIERNVFLSLHSGLGIDTYPFAVDESPARVKQILQLLCGLAAKYKKQLSIRLISDGKARKGERTNFNNKYLKDATVRAL